MEGKHSCLGYICLHNLWKENIHVWGMSVCVIYGRKAFMFGVCLFACTYLCVNFIICVYLFGIISVFKLLTKMHANYTCSPEFLILQSVCSLSMSCKLVSY